MIDPDLYLAPYNSEINLGKTGVPPSYRGCGISTDWHGTAFATLGETTVDRTGKRKDRRALTRDLKRGWKAFRAEPDSNGIPDTGDLVRIHAAMFPKTPDPIQFWTRDWSEVMDQFEDHVISIAVRLSALPQDQRVDPYTRADHQVLLARRDGDRARVYGPMRPHSMSYRGHMAPLSEVRESAKAIEDGLILTWLYPIGGWTKQRLTARKLRTRYEKMIESRDEDIRRLEAALLACEGADPEGCADKVRDERERIVDSFAEHGASIIGEP